MMSLFLSKLIKIVLFIEYAKSVSMAYLSSSRRQAVLLMLTKYFLIIWNMPEQIMASIFQYRCNKFVSHTKFRILRLEFHMNLIRLLNSN